jgi:hypothetical protein
MGDEITSFYKRKIEPFIAIFILIFLIVGCVLLYQDNQLKKEISSNCGWEEENYVCYCEKNFIDNKRIELGEYELDLEGGDINVSLDR